MSLRSVLRSSGLAFAITAALTVTVGCDSSSDGGDPGESAEEASEESTGENAGEAGEEASGEEATGEESGEEATGEEASGEEATGEEASGEEGTGEEASGEEATGEEGGGATLDDALGAMASCGGCHGGVSCTTGICFLDDPAILAEPPAANSSWCTSGETSLAECAANLMEDGLMPIGCANTGSCPSADDVATVRAWVEAGFPQ